MHREEPVEGHWFEDRECVKCGKQEIEHHAPFFGSISDAAKLGAHIGVYKALGIGKMEKMIDDELQKQLKARGLKLAKPN